MFSYRRFAMAFALAVLPAHAVFATNYRVMALSEEAFPGQQFAAWLLAETMPNDNVVGYGLYSFAIDMSFSGSAIIPGSAVGNVIINTSVFNDSFSNSIGHAQGNQYVGIAGVTTDLAAPNPGANVGDVVRLFDFSIGVPLSAVPGTSFTIAPSEGFLQNLTVNPNFDPVNPQTFASLTIAIVPEPGVLLPLLMSWMMLHKRPSRRAEMVFAQTGHPVLILKSCVKVASD